MGAWAGAEWLPVGAAAEEVQGIGIGEARAGAEQLVISSEGARAGAEQLMIGIEKERAGAEQLVIGREGARAGAELAGNRQCRNHAQHYDAWNAWPVPVEAAPRALGGRCEMFLLAGRCRFGAGDATGLHAHC